MQRGGQKDWFVTPQAPIPAFCRSLSESPPCGIYALVCVIDLTSYRVCVCVCARARALVHVCGHVRVRVLFKYVVIDVTGEAGASWALPAARDVTGALTSLCHGPYRWKPLHHGSHEEEKRRERYLLVSQYHALQVDRRRDVPETYCICVPHLRFSGSLMPFWE